MKNLVLLLSLVFLIQANSVCQSFPYPSATWTIAFIIWGTYLENETFTIEGDTTINSIQYKSIYSTKDSIYNPLISTYFCAVRELNNKWFFVPADSTKEFMLYNFDAEIGDTVAINNPWAYGESELIVFDIDSLELNGSYYKKIALGFYDNFSGKPYVFDHWIAGIGSTQGFYLSGLHMMDAGFELLCFHRNDTLIYLNSPSGTCGYISTGVKSNSLISEVTLSPNPVFDKLTVISNHDLQVEVYDISGKKLISSDSRQIDVSHLAKGIYFVKMFNPKMKFLKSEKIIKR